MDFDEWVDRSLPMTDQEKTFAYFAWKAATEAEREACAKVCEAMMTDTILGGNKEYNTGREMGATVCANKIRMRSNAK